MTRKTPPKKQHRSSAWFGGGGKNAFMYRSWMKNQGFPEDLFDGRPVIGICNTWSELTPCNAHLRDIAERVKRGVYEAGGFPLEFPVMSLGESNMRPTAMLFRNLASMDVEESIRANPIDGVVLLVGCDKTTPALLMGAASCDLPAIVVSGGPMLNGNFCGKPIGSGTHVWRFHEEVKAGRMSQQEFLSAEQGQSRSAGSCMTMGTASTMASMVEALGIGLPGNAATPAVDSRRSVIAHLAGRRIVDLVNEDVRMSQILTRTAFENAIAVNGAIGGSTNALIHLIAIAGRLGVELCLDDWDRLGRNVPTIVDLMPSGRFLMEDFFYAGGLPAVMRELIEADMLDATAMTVTGKTLGENCAEAPNYNSEVIRPLDNPLTLHGGVALLRGNLAPDGAVLKPSAASEHLMVHRGPAVVFENIEHYYARIEVLKNINLGVRDGEFMTVLGPSGSGKTTILRMIGGFTMVSGGSILLDGGDIAAMPINRRPFNTVFQDYALFPHMSVARNLGYGLLVKRVPGAEIAKRVKETLDLVQLGEFADRFPAQLSGGQRQRVALARAIICQPRLILLDEPLAALDVALRRQMQLFLKDIQREISTTFLFVTHDQEEAIAMADRICVMNFGKIQQVGTPHDVYYRPQTEFVARFFGDNNLVAGRLLPKTGEGTRQIKTPVGTFTCALDASSQVASAEDGRKAFAVFRPEIIAVGDKPGQVDNCCTGVVSSVDFGGETTLARVATGSDKDAAKIHVKLVSRVEGIALKPGDQVTLNWRARECRLVLA